MKYKTVYNTVASRKYNGPTQIDVIKRLNQTITFDQLRELLLLVEGGWQVDALKYCAPLVQRKNVAEWLILVPKVLEVMIWQVDQSNALTYLKTCAANVENAVTEVADLSKFLNSVFDSDVTKYVALKVLLEICGELRGNYEVLLEKHFPNEMYRRMARECIRQCVAEGEDVNNGEQQSHANSAGIVNSSLWDAEKIERELGPRSHIGVSQQEVDKLSKALTQVTDFEYIGNSKVTKAENVKEALLQLEGNSVTTDVEENLCVVCHDHKKTILFEPCRHLCCCIECARKLVDHPNCPVCRTSIQSVKAIYC